MEKKIMNKDGYCLLTARIFDDFSSGDKKISITTVDHWDKGPWDFMGDLDLRIDEAKVLVEMLNEILNNEHKKI